MSTVKNNIKRKNNKPIQKNKVKSSVLAVGKGIDNLAIFLINLPLRCKHHKHCPFFDSEAFDCRHSSKYCGKFRELEMLSHV